jgi:hypothetical protein
MATDFFVDHDHEKKNLVLTSRDKTASIRVWEENGHTHVHIEQTDDEGQDPSRFDIILDKEGHTHKC